MNDSFWELLNFCIRGTEVTIRSGREELMASVVPGTAAVLLQAGEDGTLIGELEDGRPCVLVWGRDQLERREKTDQKTVQPRQERARPGKEVTIHLVIHEEKEA